VEHSRRVEPATQLSANGETAGKETYHSGRNHWVDEMTRMVAGGVAVLFVLNTWGIGFVEDDGSAGFLGTSHARGRGGDAQDPRRISRNF